MIRQTQPIGRVLGPRKLVSFEGIQSWTRKVFSFCRPEMDVSVCIIRILEES